MADDARAYPPSLPVPLRRVASLREIGDEQDFARYVTSAPSDLAYTMHEHEDGMGVTHCIFQCPRDPRRSCCVPVLPVGETSPKGWTFNGNPDAPTLMPSILCHTCQWHGYITDGALRNA